MSTFLRMLLMVVVIGLAACEHTPERADEAVAYVNAQSEAIIGQKPLFELVAQPGAEMRLVGVERITVRDPRIQRVTPLPATRHTWLDAVLGVARIGAQVYGAKVIADGVVDLVEEMGDNTGDHSVTNITSSFNDQSTDIADSFNSADTAIDVSGTGNALGDDNVVDFSTGDRVNGPQTIATGDRNFNRGRQDSPNIDADNDGDDCIGSDCSVVPEDPEDPEDPPLQSVLACIANAGGGSTILDGC